MLGEWYIAGVIILHILRIHIIDFEILLELSVVFTRVTSIIPKMTQKFKYYYYIK